ncbi:protein kinase domain-containing protein [Amycolatopsis pretoriensis]|nr:protein kinase [Amycolatopsis pretoriensis]
MDGDRTAYRLNPRPLARGGQAEVIVAEHKVTGAKVAFKRLNSRNPRAVARMRREIELGGVLRGHAHVMPVLDHGPAFDWFVMPLAEENAEQASQRLTSGEKLVELLHAVCAALGAAHDLGWVHRDLKPANLLLLEDKWMVADWGLGRRPRGDTTFNGRTVAGQFLGTEGFAAPEQETDPHGALATVDIYSVGQIIGWARTRQEPRQGQALIPADEPWRTIVAAATDRVPERRPQTAAALRQLIDDELARTA